jgi:hypothetical protein
MGQKEIKMKVYLVPLVCMPPLIVAMGAGGCTMQTPGQGGVHFTILDKDRTGIDFDNQLTESDSVNFYTNEYMYIGSGVGIGDFNRDGLPDIFFCGSQVSSRLYLNKGDFHFEDITSGAGVGTHTWCTGTSVVDINGDGWPDIYICCSHSHDPQQRRNLLFVNQGLNKDGIPTFREQAAAYGLADTGYSTQAVFFDYDKDGLLDMYLLHHRLYNPHPNDIVAIDTSGQSPAQDRLFHNEGVPPGGSHPVFRDVTMETGIRDDGYGLGVVVSDVNGDGWPDIYVANDYVANDLLWLNNGDGTFRNVIARSLRHQSYNSMGVDAADINNDGRTDIAVLDMLPETNERKKMMYAGATPERYDMERRAGFQPSFTRNMLQLNMGNLPAAISGAKVAGNPAGPAPGTNRPIPFFSEIGELAGISETDWSWSVLMADFNNDGWKDLYITNGLARDLTNNDFLFYQQGYYRPEYSFGGPGAGGSGGGSGSSIHVPGREGRRLSTEQVHTLRMELEKWGSIRVPNYLFLNEGGIRFSDQTQASGLGVPSVSQGAAYADLDNDGNLDLVVNNMTQPAFIIENMSGAGSGAAAQGSANPAHHFLTVILDGKPGNRAGIGSRVILYSRGGMQCVEQSPVRGYASTVDDRLHFGTGADTVIDSLAVVWPDESRQVLRHIPADRFITVRYAAPGKGNGPGNEADDRVAGGVPQGGAGAGIAGSGPTFTDVADALHIDFFHIERPFFDFGFQRMLPQKYSQLGPPLASADVNGDGLEDFFIGGASGQAGKLWIQQPDGSFKGTDVGDPGKYDEDLGAVFFDANGDHYPDLLVTGGSSEFGTHSPYNRPRLYLNDGKGHFTLDEGAIPPDIAVIARAVTVGDYDGDGWPDIFIGGRVLPMQYPNPPRSYILRNDKGVFRDVTAQVCPALESPGLVTDAIWTDFNGDHQPDLVICGEWMPVRFFRNDHGRLNEVTQATGLKDCKGLWRSLKAVDIDHDGDTDYVVGNMGWNNGYRLSPTRPLCMFAKDMDHNGIIDLVPAYYIKNAEGAYRLYPDPDRTQLAEAVPSVKKKYLQHADFARLDMEQLRKDFGTEGWTALQCETSSSVWLENEGNGHFRMHELPPEAQFAPVNAILAADLDGDGNTDLVLAGNEYQSAPGRGRYDASYGLVLRGDGKGGFRPLQPAETGFILDGDVRALLMLEEKRKRLVMAAVNNDRLRCFKINGYE